MPPVTGVLATPWASGAVALIQLCGPGVEALLHRLTGLCDWPPGRVRLADFGQIDQGLAVVLRSAAQGVAWGQLMPHGGPRVVRLLLDHLRTLGVDFDEADDSRLIFPEAASRLEADMLATLTRAASPAAVEWLMRQPRCWRNRLRHGPESLRDAGAILARSDVLDRLVRPPTVVVVGRPNVGKSTWTNRVLGRTASLVADLPGTTRDWVGGLAELPWTAPAAPGQDAYLAVAWMDTPGLRDSDDPVERKAIELARQVVVAADVLMAMRDPHTDWPDPATLPRRPDLWVMNKADLWPSPRAVMMERSESPLSPGSTSCHPLLVSATTGYGESELAAAVVTALGFGELEKTSEQPWAFSPTLREATAHGGIELLANYCGIVNCDP